MKEEKYLPFYYEWMKDGRQMPYGGLCGSFRDDLYFCIMYPTARERLDCISPLFWASGDVTNEEISFTFTPLRQTIVLFLAAMNNEL